MGDGRAGECQLAWSREQLRILDAIDERLVRIREIAQYAMDHVVSSPENERLNERLDRLQGEVNLLQASIIQWEEVELQVRH